MLDLDDVIHLQPHVDHMLITPAHASFLSLDEVKHLHKLYWDARVSVLGFKAQIVKLTGEGERQQQLIQQQSGSSFVRKVRKLSLPFLYFSSF